MRILLAIIFVLQCSCDDSHITANVPKPEDFHPLLLQELKDFFESKVGTCNIKYDLLREHPTQVGVAYPKYYLWVTVTQKDGFVISGAARVAAMKRKRFRITNFLNTTEMAADVDLAGTIFPDALIPAIKQRAGITR